MVWTVADDQSRAWASGPCMECKMSFLTSRSSESAALHPTRGTEGTSFKAEPGHNLTSHQEPNDVVALLRAQLGTLVAEAAHHVAKECSSARATATVTGSGMHVRPYIPHVRTYLPGHVRASRRTTEIRTNVQSANACDKYRCSVGTVARAYICALPTATKPCIPYVRTCTIRDMTGASSHRSCDPQRRLVVDRSGPSGRGRRHGLYQRSQRVVVLRRRLDRGVPANMRYSE